MSLAKRRELEDIKAKNEKISAEIVARYNHLKSTAYEAAKRDFTNFFRKEGFTIGEAKDNSFFHNQPQGILASYEKLNARFSEEKSPNMILLESNIKGQSTKYTIHVVIDNPKAESGPSGSFRIPQEENARLDWDIEQAQKSLAASEATKNGLGEARAAYQYTTIALGAGQPNRTHHQNANSFTDLLNHLFN